MRFLLRDRNAAVVEAWRKEFARAPDMEVSQGDIFDLIADAIVSPANSFGFMDGGIDLAYSHRFGWGLQERLQERLRAEHDGELPVGQAIVVETMDSKIPFMVSAPTMRVPADVSGTVNAYLAFRAVIRAVREHNRLHERPLLTVLCPGLGTAIGRMSPRACAVQMHYAYGTVHLGQAWRLPSLAHAKEVHHRMLG
jgi:O-acetyl-ADP-ribose deacetylase (regulator of RNase III)